MVVALAFEADDGSRVIASHVDVQAQDGERSEGMDFLTFYEIERTVAQIQSGAYKRIALQFPDSLLPDAVRVQHELRERLQDTGYERMFVLGDTSYGSCCVDEVAAQHLFADCIVHYGRTCLSATSKIPVIYVFGNAPIDTPHCVDALSDKLQAADPHKQVVLLYEPCYRHACDAIFTALEAAFPDRKFLFGTMKTFYDPTAQAAAVDDVAEDKEAHLYTTVVVGGQELHLHGDNQQIMPENVVLLYVGTESAHLTSILLRYSTVDCFSYNPTTMAARKEGATVNRALMRRFFLVQQAKEAQIFGILMGTLGVANYLDVVHSLQALIKKSGRKSYLFVVGKVNVPKLANYAEIDAFVLVACQQNTLMDSKEFYKPIVTPYELQLALSSDDEWTGEYKTDFSEVLPALHETTQALDQQSEEDADKPFFSLVSGTYKTATNGRATSLAATDAMDDASGTALQVKNQQTDLVAYHSEAGDFLATREYRGLDPRIGETPAHAAVMGSTGIARGYDHEER